MWRIFMLLFMLHATAAILIPEEAEMLDGFAPAPFPEVSPELDYFEARSLSAGSLFNSVRNKRNSEYEVKESNGLVSHFRRNSVNGYTSMFEKKKNYNIPTSDSIRPLEHLMRKKFPSRDDGEEEKREGPRQRLKSSRQRRSVPMDKKIDGELQKDIKKSNQRVENLPSAMKLTKTSNGFASSQNGPSTAALVSSKWIRSPFEYSKIQTEEDSLAMDSSSTTLNEGMKSRTPRVNFVTQQKKSLDHDETKASATKSEFYKSPPLLHNSKESTSATSSASNERERYPERGSTMRPVTYPDYRNRDMNSNRYDDRYIEDMYPPPPDFYDPMYDYRQYPHIDPYMQRPSYSEYNNNYHSHRYDLPDYQDYPPMYGNDIESRYYMRSDMPPPSSLPRKRTIYYAYLPEVVRSPPTVDFRYRSHDRYDPYYNDYGNNYYDQPMVSGAYRRPLPERQMTAEKSSMRLDYRTSRPLRIQDDAAKISTSKEKRFDQDKSYYDGAKRPMYTYSYRRPIEYNSMY